MEASWKREADEKGPKPASRPVELLPSAQGDEVLRQHLESHQYLNPDGTPFVLSREQLRAGREDGDDF